MSKYFYFLLFIIIVFLSVGLFYLLSSSDLKINKASSKEDVRLTYKNVEPKKIAVKTYETITKTIPKPVSKITPKKNNQSNKVYVTPKKVEMKKNGGAEVPTARYYSYVAAQPSAPAMREVKQPKPISRNLETTKSVETPSVSTVKKVVVHTEYRESYTPDVSQHLSKYVLFSVNYDSEINAGDTESLRLIMSPRNKLENLQKALQEGKIRKNQINDIEKVEKEYKYISAKLVTKDNCLNIQKIMPEEDKVYLPSVNESTADQVWQWDLTAPSQPSISLCHLALFIRYCKNQHDCIPTYDPDKEFNIRIQITRMHQFYAWFNHAGNIANLSLSIITLISFVGAIAWGKRWRNRRRQPTTIKGGRNENQRFFKDGK